MSPAPIRKIIHIDMDAFFASVEQYDNPDLRGKPIVVGGNKERGVVAAASYEARKYGVFSAMPGKIAYRRCSKLIFVKLRMHRYKEVSEQIMCIFKEYTDLVEPLSIDEAFLDVTINKKNIKSASKIAQEIKQRIKVEIGITASAGVSINKFLAKQASDYNKPDGLYIISPNMIDSFIEQLPIHKFYGVGKVTSSKMHKLGIFRGLELKKISIEDLKRIFGKQGIYFFNIARGIDNRQVNPNRERKSISTEHTFEKEISSIKLITDKVNKLSEELFLRMHKNNLWGRTICLKIKYSNFAQHTRSKTVSSNIRDISTIKQISKDLLYQEDIDKSLRLIGISISNFKIEKKAIQLEIDFANKYKK